MASEDRELWDAWQRRHTYPAYVHLANFIAHVKAIDATLQPGESQAKIPLAEGLRTILQATDIPSEAYDLDTTVLAIDKLYEWGVVGFKDNTYYLPAPRGPITL